METQVRACGNRLQPCSIIKEGGLCMVWARGVGSPVWETLGHLSGPTGRSPSRGIILGLAAHTNPFGYTELQRKNPTRQVNIYPNTHIFRRPNKFV